MKVLKLLTKIVVLLVVIALALLSLATIVPQIPIVGSIANYFTVRDGHWFIVGVTGLLVFCTLCCVIKKKKVLAIVVEGLLILSLSMSICAMAIAVRDVNKQGGEVNVWKSFSKIDVSDVKTDTKTYCVSEYGNVELNVYYVRQELGDGAEGFPVLFYIHGGGWIGGSKNDHTYDSKVYAKNGYVVVSVDYDLSRKDRHLVGTTEKQITEAVAWVKKNISKYGGDYEKLYFTGDSAGGNLALEVAYKINGGVYTTAGEKTLPKVKAVCVTYPVADPELFYNNDDLVLGKAARNMALNYTGYTPEENKEIYESIKPTNFLSEETPPTFVIVGKTDTMVQPVSSVNLVQALQQKGIEAELVTVSFCNHAFDTVPGNFGDQAVQSWTLKWFNSHK